MRSAVVNMTSMKLGTLRERRRQNLVHQLVVDNNVNKVFDEMLMFVRVLRFVYIPCTAKEQASRFGIQRNGQPFARRHHEDKQAKKNVCYSSTLVTKLDGAQGKAGRLVKDETVQSGRCCVTTERVVQSSQR
ncbi:hypothetical protein BHM03_00034635 [Ensete ventricosum]|nr:hypothetical protein BHM03_00034635 [Ensete ventricosum]